MINFSKNEKIDCDFLIIGSGASGSVASKYLVDRGKDVLMIEEGEGEIASKTILFRSLFECMAEFRYYSNNKQK